MASRSAAVRHVLMTADAVGGVWTYARDLAHGLADAGVRTTLAVMGSPPSRAQRQELGGIACVEGPFKLEWMPDPWADLARAGNWLLDLEQRLQPDVIHLNGFALGALPWRAPVVMVGHSCVLSWWEAVHGSPAPPEWNRYRDAAANGLVRADLVAAPSAAMLAMLRRHYGNLPRTRIIFNGRTPSPGPAAAWKEPLMLTAGRLWDGAKNIEAVVGAAGAISWPVYIAGATTNPGAALQSAPPSSAGVTYLGALPAAELAQWMQRAAIYVMPARYEPFGLSILEAAQSGCALVLGDIPSLREVWEDAALYVAPHDHGALAAAIERLIRDEPLRLDLARRARRRSTLFTVSRMTAAYLEAYADVVRRPVAAPAAAASAAGCS